MKYLILALALLATPVMAEEREVVLTDQEIEIVKNLMMRGAGAQEDAFLAAAHLIGKLNAAEPVQPPEPKEPEQ